MGMWDWNDDDGNPSRDPWLGIEWQAWWTLFYVGACIIFLIIACNDSSGGGGTSGGLDPKPTPTEWDSMSPEEKGRWIERNLDYDE